MTTNKHTYKVHTATNFSIGAQEFYLKPGQEVELPEHELIHSMLTHKHLSRIEPAAESKIKKPENK